MTSQIDCSAVSELGRGFVSVGKNPSQRSSVIDLLLMPLGSFFVQTLKTTIKAMEWRALARSGRRNDVTGMAHCVICMISDAFLLHARMTVDKDEDNGAESVFCS